MGIAFKIAWRNIWKHKAKSIVIGFILMFGAFLMTVGNAMISGMEKGFEDNIINSFTGDIVILAGDQEKDNVLLDMMSVKPIEVIPDYARIKEVLDNEEIVYKYLPAGAGYVFVFTEVSDMLDSLVLGVDIEQYQEMFPGNIVIEDGEMLNPNQRGVMVSTEIQNMVYDFMDFWMKPLGTEIDFEKLPEEAQENYDNLVTMEEMVFMGITTSNTAPDVRVPITGIFRYNALNKIWGYYAIVDIESFRESHNYITGRDANVELDDSEMVLFQEDNLDFVFEFDDMFGEFEDTDEMYTLEAIQEQVRREEESFIIDTDAGAYNIIFLKLTDGVSERAALERLEQIFEENNLDVRAISWKRAVGIIGSIANLVRGSLFMFILFIFFVAIIIIMNTLSMAALERTSEIGMMRAIGAQKSFLRKMFVSETALLSFFFGAIGILLGILVVYILRGANITTDNEFLQLAFGGDTLNPIVGLFDILLGILELAIVTILAVIYPIRVVGKITPLDAISRE